MRRFLLALALLIGLDAQAAPIGFERLPDGILRKRPEGTLKVQFLGKDLARIVFAKDPAALDDPSLARIPLPTFTGWDLQEPKGSLLLSTQSFRVRVDNSTGKVAFEDPQGKVLLSEAGRSLSPAKVQGESTFHARQVWTDDPEESLYGLGEHQFGNLDWKGWDLDLWQHNTSAVVPFLVSNKGYGILWDNPSFTRFGDLREFAPIPSRYLLDKDGQPGGLTLEKAGTLSRTPGLQADLKNLRWDEKPKSLHWQGSLKAPSAGTYQFDCASNGGLKVWLDGVLMMEQWRQGWLTDHDRARLDLKAGQRVPIRIEWDTEQGTTLDFRWKTPAGSSNISLWSEAADKVDYTFVQGPSLEKVVAGYRTLTGPAPMMPRWAFGLWQSRQRYKTAQESLEVVREFRKRGIPFDNIVQDWQYWKKDAWGSHEFDPERFPDPEGWIKALHGLHAHLMISVWPKFYAGTVNYQAMMEQGFLYRSIPDKGIKDWLGFPYSFYDAFNPEARKAFWAGMQDSLFRKGVDAWWMDATEPDLMPSPPTREALQEAMDPTAEGRATKVLNAFPLMNSRAVEEGQRAAASDKRVFILTRCAYAGSQRTASTVWSGDITATWSFLSKQVAAGLNMSLSGIPYWTTDIGGYTMPRRFSDAKTGSPEEEEWRELNVRWFQFASFCPLLRSHGELRPREMWEFGGGSSSAYQAMLKFDRLRYRLFPYLYSTAWKVTKDGSTFLRPLVMDFPDQKDLRRIGDQYLLGPSLLVCPVLAYKSRSREVVLPQGTPWYDFWSGKSYGSGPLEAEAPFDALPLFVKAGSILPLGPELRYIGEKPMDPITLIVYAGADGDFTLYEDDGETTGYEKGEYAEIPLHWDDQDRTLTLGERKGSFPGMRKARRFQVLRVTAEDPVGFSFGPKPEKVLDYDGKTLTWQAEPKGP